MFHYWCPKTRIRMYIYNISLAAVCIRDSRLFLMLSICFVFQVRLIFLSWQPGHASNLLQIIWQFRVICLSATRPEIADTHYALWGVAPLMLENVISSYILLGMPLLINAGRILCCKYYHNQVSPRCQLTRNHCPRSFLQNDTTIYICCSYNCVYKGIMPIECPI